MDDLDEVLAFIICSVFEGTDEYHIYYYGELERRPALRIYHFPSHTRLISFNKLTPSLALALTETTLDGTKLINIVKESWNERYPEENWSTLRKR